MKIVIDTNVIASAIFFGGKPKEILEKVMIGDLQTFATKEIIAEYVETIDYLHNKYANKAMNPALSVLLKKIKLIECRSSIEICRDPDDNKFIECALDAKCFYIVSGDKDLLSIKKFEKIQIVTVSEFLTICERHIID